MLLVFQVGQPRIWMSMSRDGLLPKSFSKIHTRFKTPWFSTVIAGILVAVPSLFMNLTEVTDLTSIGTLFAFILVSGGVLVLQAGWKKDKSPASEHGFQVTYLNSRYFLPIIWAGVLTALYYWNRQEILNFSSRCSEPSGMNWLINDGWTTISQNFPIILFIITAVILTWFAIRKEFSLIPALGLLTNLYLMAQLGITNWLRFLLWLAIGLVIYFSYGRRHSRQRNIEISKA